MAENVTKILNGEELLRPLELNDALTDVLQTAFSDGGYVKVTDVLYALAMNPPGNWEPLITKTGEEVNPNSIKLLGKNDSEWEQDHPIFAPSLVLDLSDSQNHSSTNAIGPEHLLLRLVRGYSSSELRGALESLGVDPNKFVTGVIERSTSMPSVKNVQTGWNLGGF